jgi:hypothetical protein
MLKMSNFAINTNSKLPRDLKSRSETLWDISRSFVDRGAALDRIVSFFETRKMDNMNFKVRPPFYNKFDNVINLDIY